MGETWDYREQRSWTGNWVSSPSWILSMCTNCGEAFCPRCMCSKVGSGCHLFLIFLMNFGSSHVFTSQECRMRTNVTDRPRDGWWVKYQCTDGSDLLNFVAAATEDIKYPSSHKLALWKQNLGTRALQPSISRERSIWMTAVLTSVGLHSNHS